MARMGRPKIDNPKKTQISARLTQETLDKLDVCAKYYNKTKAEILRMGIEKLFEGIKIE